MVVYIISSIAFFFLFGFWNNSDIVNVVLKMALLLLAILNLWMGYHS